jgi:hypothetical protein
MIVLALIVAAGAFKSIHSQPLHRWFTTLWVLVPICFWFTVALAGIMHFQIITVLFIALGVHEFVDLINWTGASLQLEKSQNRFHEPLILGNGVILSPQKRIPERTALIAKEKRR